MGYLGYPSAGRYREREDIMMIRFEQIFWRQITAAGIAIAVYAMFFGSMADAIGPLFIYGLVLCMQDWRIDKIRERSDRDHGNGIGRCRKSA